MRQKKTLEEKFWSKVRRSTKEECWLWTASLDSRGYGQLAHEGGLFRAHRISYGLNVGPIPDGLDLDHLCRIRHCVNPAHLRPCPRRANLENRTDRANGLTSSRFHGVYRMPNGKWRARIWIAGRRVQLGVFWDEKDAAEAVMKARPLD